MNLKYTKKQCSCEARKKRFSSNFIEKQSYKVKEITLKNGDVVYAALAFNEFGSYGHHIIKNSYGYNIDINSIYEERYYKTKEEAYYAIAEYKKKIEAEYAESIKMNNIKKGRKEASSKTMNVNFK